MKNESAWEFEVRFEAPSGRSVSEAKLTGGLAGESTVGIARGLDLHVSANHEPPLRRAVMCGHCGTCRSRDSTGSMTDFGNRLRSSDDFIQLFDLVAAARAQTRANAEKYVQVRRQTDATVQEARAVRAQAAVLRESLRDSVAAYVSALRRMDVPPDRGITLVKSAVVESDPYPDKHQRCVVEEAVRWAVDAFSAA